MGDQGQSSRRIRDARGRSVSQLDPVVLCALHRHEVIEADALEQIVNDLEPGTVQWYRRMILVIPGLIVLAAAGCGLLYYFSDPAARQDLVSSLTNPALIVPGLVCCFLVPWITAREARFKRVGSVMLNHRRCPHCGYNLHGLPVAPNDGATVCPECGCAWRLDDAAIADGLRSAAASAGSTQAQRRFPLAVGLLLGILALAGLLVWWKMQ